MAGYCLYTFLIDRTITGFCLHDCIAMTVKIRCRKIDSFDHFFALCIDKSIFSVTFNTRQSIFCKCICFFITRLDRNGSGLLDISALTVFFYNGIAISHITSLIIDRFNAIVSFCINITCFPLFLYNRHTILKCSGIRKFLIKKLFTICINIIKTILVFYRDHDLGCFLYFYIDCLNLFFSATSGQCTTDCQTKCKQYTPFLSIFTHVFLHILLS